jgi:hypothetical protein
LYCFDTSAFIDAWRDYYPPDVFPSFWKNMEGLVNSGLLISSEEVLKELEAGGDELYDWARKQSGLFISLDSSIQSAVASILSHPEHRKLINLKTPSKTSADPWVIATAQVKSCPLVSTETLLASPSPYKTKIPNVCQDLGVTHLSLLEFIRQENWKF